MGRPRSAVQAVALLALAELCWSPTEAFAYAARARSDLPCNASTTLGFFHPACDKQGNLLPPPGGVQYAVDQSVLYYSRAPTNVRDFWTRDHSGAMMPHHVDSHSFPTYVWATFLASNCTPSSTDIIAGMQGGMGIIGYVKLAARRGRAGDVPGATAALQTAVRLAEYLMTWANSPYKGVWTAVTRSTGDNTEWPLKTASQTDADFGPDTIEPDKVALAGWALLYLYNATDPMHAWAPSQLFAPVRRTILAQALRNANVLTETQAPGDEAHSPWPFRVNAVTGAAVNGAKSGNTAFSLRLFRDLVEVGHPEFAQPAAQLWNWVRVPRSRSLLVNFFEDQDAAADDNRISWVALELARYLLEQRHTDFDPEWQKHVDALFAFALGLFGYPGGVGNVTLMGEQDHDTKGWGGASSKLGALASLYACAGGPAWYRRLGANNAYWMAYFTDPTDGARAARAYEVGATPERGGWTEDAWLDVLHNLVTHLDAEDGVC